MDTSDQKHWEEYCAALKQIKEILEEGQPKKPRKRDQWFRPIHTASFPDVGDARLLEPRPFVELLENHIRRSEDLAKLNSWWNRQHLYPDSSRPTRVLSNMVELCRALRKNSAGGKFIELQNLVVSPLAR